jgi:hypothetical protein
MACASWFTASQSTAQGMRSEMQRYLARRESAPGWVRATLDQPPVFNFIGAVFPGWAWLSGDAPDPTLWRAAFIVLSATFVVRLVGGSVLYRSFPRLELRATAEPRSARLKRNATAAVGYVATAVLGALADRLLR